MDRLAGFLERRRWLILAGWLVVLLAALPFAAMQTEHLTSGGFEVPGSQSQVVSENIARFEGAQRDQLAVVLARRDGAGAAAVRAQVDRVGRIADELPNVELSPRAAAAAKRDAAAASITVVPLKVSGDRDDSADMAVDFRDELLAGGSGAVEPYLVGQQALWAAIQASPRGAPEGAGGVGSRVGGFSFLRAFGPWAAGRVPRGSGSAR